MTNLIEEQVALIAGDLNALAPGASDDVAMQTVCIKGHLGKILSQARPAITVQVRSSYGRDLVYPMDDRAALFARLINARTFSREHLRVIKALGYTVNVAAGQLPFEI